MSTIGATTRAQVVLVPPAACSGRKDDVVGTRVRHQSLTEIHPQLPPEHRRILDGVEYVRLIAVNLALDQRPSELSLFLAFADQAEPDLAAIFSGHNRHPDRAPAGKGIVTVYWDHEWNTDHWHDSEAEIVEQTVRATSKYIPGLQDSIFFSHLEYWDPSFVYSKPGMYTALHDLAEARAQANRIHLAGDYFGGPATNTSLCSGDLAAENVIRTLRRSPAAVV